MKKILYEFSSGVALFKVLLKSPLGTLVIVSAVAEPPVAEVVVGRAVAVAPVSSVEGAAVETGSVDVGIGIGISLGLALAEIVNAGVVGVDAGVVQAAVAGIDDRAVEIAAVNAGVIGEGGSIEEGGISFGISLRFSVGFGLTFADIASTVSTIAAVSAIAAVATIESSVSSISASVVSTAVILGLGGHNGEEKSDELQKWDIILSQERMRNKSTYQKLEHFQFGFFPVG